MRCNEVKKSIMTYLNGRLHHEKAAAFKSHLEICPLCREFYAEEVEMAAAFSTDTAGLAGENFISNVMEKIETFETAKTPARAFGFSMKPWLIAGTCAAALALVIIGLLGTGLDGVFEEIGIGGYFAQLGDGAKGALASFGEAFTDLFDSGRNLYNDSSAEVGPSIGSLMPIIGIITALAFIVCAGLIGKFRKGISEELVRT